MSWGRFDDQYPRHRKIRPLSDAAFRLDVSGVLWSAAESTDGVIPADDLPAVSDVKRPRPAAAELVKRGRWHTAGHTCPTCPQPPDGWVIHDFLDYNRSREQGEKLREIRAEAGRRGGQKSGYARSRAKQTGKQLASPADGVPDTQTLAKTASGNHAVPDTPQGGNPQVSAGTGTPETKQFASGLLGKLPSKNEPPFPVPPIETSSPPSSYVPPANEDGGGGISHNQLRDLDALVDEIAATRPEWAPGDIRRALADPAVARRPWPLIQHAARTVAADPATRWPSRIAAPGPWWAVDDEPRVEIPPPATDQLDSMPRFDPDGVNGRGRALMHSQWNARRNATTDPDDQQHDREAS